MTGRLITGAVADVAGWRGARAAVAGAGLACALLVLVLRPASRNFVPAPARPRDLVTMTRRALSDRGLLALYAIGACAMGAFVAVYNAIGFRLTSAPYHLSLGQESLVFLIYPVGTVTSALAGRMVERYSRRTVVPAGVLITMAGVALTLLGPLPLVVLGVAVMTAGFFVVHGVASGWGPVRGPAGGGVGG